MQTIECTTHRVDPKVNYGLWVITTSLCRVILGKMYHMVKDVDNRGDRACVGQGGTWESLYFPLNFVVSLKLL